MANRRRQRVVLHPDDPFFDFDEEAHNPTQDDAADGEAAGDGGWADGDEAVAEAVAVEKFCCGIGSCRAAFTSASAHEAHYNSSHRHSCATCGGVFASDRLLGLHVVETHDSHFRVLAKTTPSYECLVEECGQMFHKPRSRRRHLVREHNYPDSFRFHVARADRKGKRGRNEAAGGGQSAGSAMDGLTGPEPVAEEPSEGRGGGSGGIQVTSPSVPMKISFGRRRGRGW